MNRPQEKPATAQRAPKTPAPRHDPRHLQLSGELRDRFLEQASGEASLLLPTPEYQVARVALPNPSGAGGNSSRPAELIEVKALPAAA